MGRHDNADVSELSLPDPSDPKTEYIGKGGVAVQSEREAFAKIVKDGTSKTFHVKFGRGDIFDPFGADQNMQGRPYYDFKKVTSDIFDHYISYLTNRERIYYTRARRLLMEV
jgi:hypothetical protein